MEKHNLLSDPESEIYSNEYQKNNLQNFSYGSQSGNDQDVFDPEFTTSPQPLLAGVHRRTKAPIPPPKKYSQNPKSLGLHDLSNYSHISGDPTLI